MVKMNLVEKEFRIMRMLDEYGMAVVKWVGPDYCVVIVIPTTESRPLDKNTVFELKRKIWLELGVKAEIEVARY